MFRRLALCLALCALILVGCRSAPGEAPVDVPVDAPVAPAVEEAAPAVEVQPRQRIEPAGEVERIGAFDPEAGNAEPTATPEPTIEPTRSETVAPDEAPETEDVAAVEEVPGTVEGTQAEAPQESDVPATATPQPMRPTVVQLPPTRPPAKVISTSALILRPDDSPAPPLVVLVSMNRSFEGHLYRVSGLVRNGADEPYTGLWINATFYRDDGSRYGAVRVKLPCLILEPGESCPFLVETGAEGIAQMMLHPDGRPAEEQVLPVELRGIGRYQDSLGWVHITGRVHNPNPVPTGDVSITGVLIDDLGQIVSLGLDLLLEPIDPGDSAPFEVLIRHAPYVRYELFVQALPR